MVPPAGWPPWWAGRPGESQARRRAEPASASACRQLPSPTLACLFCTPALLCPGQGECIHWGQDRAAPLCLIFKGPQLSLGPSKGKAAKNQPCLIFVEAEGTWGPSARLWTWLLRALLSGSALEASSSLLTAGWQSPPPPCLANEPQPPPPPPSTPRLLASASARCQG